MSNNSSTNTTEELCFFLFVGFDHVYGFEWTFVFSIILNIILSITAIIGNAIVVVTIWNNSTLHTPSNCLLFSLAVSDFGVGLIVQPFCVAYKMGELLMVFDVYCFAGVASEILALTFSATAFMTISAISVDRFLAIHLHLRYNALVLVSRVIKVVFLLWFLGLACAACRLVCFVVNCSVMIKILAVIFVLFLFVTITCYIKIGLTVRRHLKMQIHPSGPTSTFGETDIPSGKSTNISNIHIHQKKKSVITMLYVVGTFVGCFMPYMGTLLVCVLLEWNPFSRALLNVVFPIVFLNSSLNPLLYFWRMRDLRHFAKETLRKLSQTCKKKH